MANHLFPPEIIDTSVEKNFQKHSVKTKIIYSTTILFIIAAFGALPFVFVDVSIRSQGIIQPISERNKIITIKSGKIIHLYIEENEPVIRGEKIAEIDAPLLQKKMTFNSQRQLDLRDFLKDLSVLQAINSKSLGTPISLVTSNYKRSFFHFKQQVSNIRQKIDRRKRTHDRNERLYHKEVLSPVKYEASSYALLAAQNELKLLIEQQLIKWQSQQINYQDELEELKTEADQLKSELQQYVIRSPLDGTVLDIKGLYPGSFISSGQVLAEISPDTSLIAECFIPPADIGLIKEGMKARFQVSAFDYNQWGVLEGVVKEISDDVRVVNNTPVFIVRSALHQTYLELSNGYKGKLKKGMTIQGRFTITERSLFQLLYDNANDWLNPQWDEKDLFAQNTSS